MTAVSETNPEALGIDGHRGEELLPTPAVRVLRDVEARADAGPGELVYGTGSEERLLVSGGRARATSAWPVLDASAESEDDAWFRATVESVVAIACTTEQRPRFVPADPATLAAGSYFSAVDLLPAIGAFEEPRIAKEARRLLERVLRGGGEGYAFVRRRNVPPLPVAALRPRLGRVESLLSLGAWAVHVLVVAGHGVDEAPPTIGELDGVATVVFAFDDVVYATPCPDPRLLPLKVVCVEGVLRVLRDDPVD